jgi:23S rRNA pseudouridine2605 synthase
VRDWIRAGRVALDGAVLRSPEQKLDPEAGVLTLDGKALRYQANHYFMMDKPVGVITATEDPGQKTVLDLLPPELRRLGLFPVGRLDKNTTGVLMFTNDGEMAERLTHPSYNKKKIYQVVLDHPLTEEDKEKVLAGIELTDGVVAADELEYIDARDHRQLGIEIHSGKNRIVRRIFESMGYEVKALDRVYFAGLTKKGLKKGDWRYLTEGEVNILKMGAYV